MALLGALGGERPRQRRARHLVVESGRREQLGWNDVGGDVRLLGWLRGRDERSVVRVDDTGVSTRLVGGTGKSVAWSDLFEVGVLVTDDGPHSEDVFFVLVGPGESRCVVPQGADGADALVERLVELPDFDATLFIEAMSCTSKQKFICWRRPAASQGVRNV